MIVVLAISLTLGPKIAVAASCLSGLPVMFQLLPTAIRKSERTFVLPFGLATFVGAPLGAMVLVALDPAIMKFVIAISVLGMTFLDTYPATRHAGHRVPAGSSRPRADPALCHSD